MPNSATVFAIIAAWFKNVLIPFLLLTIAIHGPFSSSSSQVRLGTSVKRAAIVTCISPLSIMQTAATIPHVKTIVGRLYLWKLFRVEADQEALTSLSSNVSTGLALRTLRFDVFFPNKFKIRGKLEKNGKQKAMLFLPGFMVDHTSYASIASRMASEGDIIVVVLSLEPLRIADEYLADLFELKQCIRSVTKLWNRRSKNNGGSLEWSIGGHSYGGYAAMRLAPQLADYLHTSSTDKLKVVVWASGNREDFLTDLSLRDDISALVLLGSNDRICKFDSAEKQRLDSYLPSDALIQSIGGGTHNNFASYPGQSVVNGVPGISRMEQHKKVSSATITFLN